MSYGQTRKFLSEQVEDDVLIESPFEETSRSGSPRSSVLLALTRKKFVIVSRRKVQKNPGIYYNRIEAQHPLDNVYLSIFKRTHRQVLKACFCDSIEKYFELGLFKKRKIFWDIWCNHIRELSSGFKVWPFERLTEVNSAANTDTSAESALVKSRDEIKEVLAKSSSQGKTRLRWTDKHLYLGSKREIEDRDRPAPMVGFGDNEELQLFYLKSEFFGNWDQDQWVQCGESTLASTREETPVDVYTTYTGEPTSKVTYTSLITTVGVNNWLLYTLISAGDEEMYTAW